MKSQLPRNNHNFDYKVNQKSIIYAGSIIQNCNSATDNYEPGKVYALVINTGINTLRGNSIQNILYAKPTNFSVFKQGLIFFISLAILLISTLISIYFIYSDIVLKLDAFKNDPSYNELIAQAYKEFVAKMLNSITCALPPSLPICISYTCFYFQYKLGNKNIKCLSDLRIYSAGRVNILILDKTGTLTEDDLELYGFQTTLVSQVESNPKKVTDFDRVELNANLYNKFYVEFWKRFSSNPEDMTFYGYKENYQNNMIYFLECLATCHSIDKINEESLGNTIDLNLLKNVKWIQEKSRFVSKDNDYV